MNKATKSEHPAGVLAFFRFQEIVISVGSGVVSGSSMTVTAGGSGVGSGVGTGVGSGVGTGVGSGEGSGVVCGLSQG